MSALPLKADMLSVSMNVCYVPIADMAEHLTKARSASWGHDRFN